MIHAIGNCDARTRTDPPEFKTRDGWPSIEIPEEDQGYIRRRKTFGSRNRTHVVAVEVSNADTLVMEHIMPIVARLRFEASPTP